jgi:hypothetical protein
MEEVERLRPRRRDECPDGGRPCPYVGCRFHLYLDVNERNGNIKFNFPGHEVWEIPATCALDVAAGSEELSLAGVGRFLNITRQRVRVVEESTLAKLREEARQWTD